MHCIYIYKIKTTSVKCLEVLEGIHIARCNSRQNYKLGYFMLTNDRDMAI